MRKYLSHTQKERHVQLIIQRDGGTRCFYCKIRLSPRTAVLEHLNGDDSLTILDNLVLSCQSCNKKKADGYDKRILKMAEMKFEYNVRSAFVGEKWPDPHEEDFENRPDNEIAINEQTWRATESFLEENTSDNREISYREALDSCVMICQQRFHHGSNNTIRRHLDALTSGVGRFERFGRGRNTTIRKRQNFSGNINPENFQN